MSHRSFALRFLLVALTLIPLARGLLAQAPQPPLRAGATAVVVDVVVRDRNGQPVVDLQKNDFELYEDGVRQEIGDVTLVAPGGVNPSTQRSDTGEQQKLTKAPATVATSSFVALVFDRLSPEARALAHRGALAYLEDTRESDFAGVFLIDLSLQTLQTYTNDRTLIRTAIERAATTATTTFNRQANKPIGSAYGDTHPAVSPTASAEEPGPPDPNTAERIRNVPKDVLGAPDITLAFIKMAERMERSYEAMVREEQGYATTNGLLALVDSLGLLPGRKTVVFFAEGLAIPPAVQARFDSVVATANRANVSIYTVDAAGLRVHSKAAETMRQVRDIGDMGLNEQRRSSKWTSDLELNEDILKQDPAVSLGILADRTGGFLINNTNDLARGFRDIDADRRFHYLLTYVPRNPEFGGEWRRLEVKAPSRRVTIRSRAGYVAVRTASTLPLLAYEGPALAALERTPPPRQLPLRAAALVFPDSSTAASRLAVLATTDGAALTFAPDEENSTYRTDFTILARIRDEAGEVVRKASQPYRMSGPIAGLQQARAGDILFFRQPRELPPGEYTLEVALHDALARVAGVHTSTFTVPASAAGSPRVSSLVIVRRGERVPAAERQDANPLYVRDVLIYPNVGEPIRKADKAVTLFFTVVTQAGAVPDAVLELLRDGQPLASVPVKLDAPDQAGVVRQLIQIPTGSLEAGEYGLRLELTQDGRRELRNASFRLVE